MKKYVIPYSFNVKGSVTVEMEDDANVELAKKFVDDYMEDCKKNLCRDVLSGFSKGNIRVK